MKIISVQMSFKIQNGNPPLFCLVIAVSSRPKSHTFTVIFSVLAPQPRWHHKSWKGLLRVHFLVRLRRSTRSSKTGFISSLLTGSLSLTMRSPKRSFISSIYPEYSAETRRWVIRCPRSKLTLVFIWNRNQTREHFMLSWNQRNVL